MRVLADMTPGLKVTRYDLNAGLGLKIALVTDLHNQINDTLIEKITSEKPDLILIAGDTLERHTEGVSKWTNQEMEDWQKLPEMNGIVSRLMEYIDRIVERNGIEENKHDYGMEFLKQVGGLAPVFLSVGNHEWYFTNDDYSTFQKNGITLLDNSDIETTIKNRRVLIGGLSTRYDMTWLKKYSAKDGFKILMCHHPEYYKYLIKGKIIDTFDLVVSGHYHGGQWKIGNRGVYVPRIGLFVKNVQGKFGKQIISSGVSNTTHLPRFRNPCEVVIIRI